MSFNAIINVIKKIYKTNCSGFSLLELIIVISIIFILSAIIFPNYRTASSQFVLERSAYKIAQDIRRTGEMAMSARGLSGEVPEGGYGIFFDIGWNNKKYRIYADTDPNEYFTSSDTLVEEITLEKGVIIQNINTPSQIGCINFKPPAPTVKIKYGVNNEISNDKIMITFALESEPSKIKKIIVNKAGLIDVE